MKRFLVLLLCLLTPFALAEGSRDLLGSGASEYRAFLESGYNNTSYAGILRKTTIYAYLSGNTEKIAVGSSALALSTANNSSIRITPLISGGTATSYTYANSCGQITTRAQEALGPSTAYTGGYVPCLYTPTNGAGLYQIDIMAPSATSTTNPTPTQVTSAWPAPTTGDCCVAAWDASVLNGTSELKGRVFAKYMSLNTGGNGTPVINLKVNVQTRDGYLYNVVQKIDPYGYIFFANNKGVLIGTESAYASSNGTSQAFHLPTDPDTTTDYTAKLFLNTPAADLPASVVTTTGSEWLKPASATLPPTPSGLSFTGKNGTPGYAGSTASGTLLGGTFTFSNPGGAGFAYRLTIPLSANGQGSVDRVLTGTSVSGTNTVTWDGLDGNGAAVPSTSTNYNAMVKLYGGELHFPLLDVENSSGLTITRASIGGVTSTTGTDSDASYVYWNDSPIAVVGTAPTPVKNLNGTTSTTPAHTWSGTYGNNVTIDTWVYYPSSSAANGNGITVRSADIRVVKTSTATSAPLGYNVVYNLAFSSLTAPGTACPGQTTCTLLVTATDPIASGFTAMSWSCPSGCAATSGTGALNTVVTLVDNATVNVKVTGTLSATAGTSVTNTASVTNANDATDPAQTNNTSSLTLNTRAAVGSLTLTKTQRNFTTGPTSAFVTTSIQVKPTDQVQYQLSFTNAGDKNVTAATVKDTLPAQLTPVGNATITCPNGTTGSITPVGQSISANVATTCGPIKAGETGTILILTTVK